MRYKVISKSGHGFILGAIVALTDYRPINRVYVNDSGLRQFLYPDQVAKLCDKLNINIRIL